EAVRLGVILRMEIELRRGITAQHAASGRTKLSRRTSTSNRASCAGTLAAGIAIVVCLFLVCSRGELDEGTPSSNCSPVLGGCDDLFRFHSRACALSQAYA